MENEQKIKGILVEFFRNGTNCDYLNALNIAIRDIKALSQHDVSGQSELLIDFADWVFNQPKHLGGRERELVAEYLKAINSH